MMDFGFGAFLEKFEAHFGRRMTKILPALIGVTVVTTCLGLISSQVINPMIQLLSPSWKRGDFLTLMFSTFWIGVGCAVGVGLGKILEYLFVTRRIIRLHGKISEIQNEHQTELENTKDKISALDIAIGAILESALSKGSITQETADLIQSLLDTVPEKQL